MLQAQGAYATALRETQQALSIQQKRLPPSHPDIIQTLEIQMRLLRALQQPERAVAAEAKARTLREQQSK